MFSLQSFAQFKFLSLFLGLLLLLKFSNTYLTHYENWKLIFEPNLQLLKTIKRCTQPQERKRRKRATLLCCLQVVMKLLENGAEVNPHDIRGNTPLHFCCNNGHMDSAALLLIVSKKSIKSINFYILLAAWSRCHSK